MPTKSWRVSLSVTEKEPEEWPAHPNETWSDETSGTHLPTLQDTADWFRNQLQALAPKDQEKAFVEISADEDEGVPFATITIYVPD